jgi:hypothetical protein
LSIDSALRKNKCGERTGKEGEKLLTNNFFMQKALKIYGRWWRFRARRGLMENEWEI